MSFVICHLSFVICHLSFVICHLSFVEKQGIKTMSLNAAKDESGRARVTSGCNPKR
ncbi:hypothetical protein [Coleofasciculus sp. F4-SAH-05]|uniref:hypothetical protein n=1 Tax=Coleofasciculus sp. F4-SAH-05 TaxID=3069525 RepID=UPI0032FAFFC3